MNIRIFLLGLMGSGKTTTGKNLSKKLSLPFYDLDEIIEKETGISISEYFSKYGEDKFREIERAALLKTFDFEKAIVATGGGTPCFYKNLEEINRSGLSFYLCGNTKLLYSRLKDKKKLRPLISSLSDEMLLNYLDSLLKSREVFYSKACYTVSAIDPVPEILWILKNKHNYSF